MALSRIVFKATNTNRRQFGRRHLALEMLEDRKLLDATGLAFGNAPYLTLSFAPDGTEAAGHSSQLSAKLNPIASQDEWQWAIVSAFQQWAIHTNADIGLVDDLGLPFGTAGSTVRDDRFGDIRIGAIPLDPQLAAISVSHDKPISGTWVGDMLLNSDADIGSLEELYSIVLHEAGHVFGLEHSDDATSIMNVHGGGGVNELNSEDIDNLQQLFGRRGDDAFEFLRDEAGNDTPEAATELKFEHSEESEIKGLTPSVVYGDITRSDDVDTFLYEVHDDYSGPVTFSLRVDGISQLRATASVFFQDGEPVTSGQPNEQGRLKITVPSATAELYFQVAADPTAESLYQVGGYSLVVTMDDRLLTDANTIDSISDGRLRLLSADDLEDLFEDDGSESPFIDTAVDANDSLPTATTVKTAPGFEQGFRYIEQGSIQFAGDRDFFAFKSPDSADDVVTVHVRPINGSTLVPKVRLHDRDQQELSTTILADGGGDLIVQATNLEPSKNYFVEVLSDGNTDLFSTGNYELTIVFGATATPLETVSTGQLDANSDRQQASLFIAQDQFFHFVLENNGQAAAGPMAVMRIFAAGDTPLFQLAAQPGKTRSGQTVRLGPGEYDVVVEGVFLAADPIAVADFHLKAAVVSDPLAVPLDDPADDPLYQCEGAVGEFCFPGGTRTFDLFFLSPFDTSVSHDAVSQTAVAQLYYNDWWIWRSEPNPSNDLANDAFESYGGERLQVTAVSGVLANEQPAGEAWTAHLVTPPTHGDLQLQSDGSFVYDPHAGFFGVDSFVYLVAESINGLGLATATVDVVPPMLGDANLDRTVDGQDLVIWQLHMFQESVLGFREGDFTDDGYVDGSDFNIWLQNRFTRAAMAHAQRSTPRMPRAALAEQGVSSLHQVHAVVIDRRQMKTKSGREMGLSRYNDDGWHRSVDAVFAADDQRWRGSSFYFRPQRVSEIETPIHGLKRSADENFGSMRGGVGAGGGLGLPTSRLAATHV